MSEVALLAVLMLATAGYPALFTGVRGRRFSEVGAVHNTGPKTLA